ncbi:MAG TPA: EAL domain-containing protein [Acidobacteriaceae bacterium]|jgi:diguanylate cyclase (GGDEF)-like protein/PAS domain S-box-containing protein|nr:EAL domain-containing protein [Acidobacteriaceae bacterium]
MTSDAQAARLRMALTNPLQVLSVSGPTETLLGYLPEDFLGARVALASRIHPGDLEPWSLLIAPALPLATGSLLLRVRHQDGRIRILRADYARDRDPDSGLIVLDLSLSPPASLPDQEARALFASFRSLMDDSDDYMYLKDRNHVFLGATRTVPQFLLQPQRDLGFPGRTVYDLHPEPYADELYRMDRQALEGRCIHQVQQLRTADGSTRWIDNRKYPLRSASGEVIGIFGICPDITEPLEAQRKLVENTELLRLFIESAPVALAMLDRDLRYLAVSRRWTEDYGRGLSSIIGRSHAAVAPEIPDRWKEDHRRALAGESTLRDEDSFTRPDGSVQWVRREVLPWRASGGAIGGILLFIENITERVHSREQMRLAASVFTHAREGIAICDPQGMILDVNEMFTHITGYRRDEILGQNPRILKSGRQSEEFYGDMWRALVQNGQWSGEVWNKAKDGRIYAEMLAIHAVRDRAGQVSHYVGMFTDITEYKEHKLQMERIANYDALTNLPNRTLLADRLSQAMAQARRRNQTLGVACLDLDGFRHVNERHGHDAGDNLLMTLAHRMRGVLREADTLARVGGDKFVALFLDVGDRASASQLLARLLAAAAEPEPCGEPAIAVSASMGAVFYPQPEDIDSGQLLRQAEQAMYHAKLSGKGCCHIFDSGQDALLRSSRDELDQIRLALAARQFVLAYQPRVHMGKGTLVGAEALIRWQHPTRGLLPPSLFLPAVENHPLIDQIGEWVMDQALTQHELWRAAGIEIPVSVNIAAHHLQAPDFAERVADLLAAHPTVDPSFLELEVLESGALRDVGQVSAVLATCREIGVSVSLDDFGTGYSSLTWLRRLPVNILKIDQSFVRDMVDNPEDIGILEGVLTLASALDRTAVAEGVETVEHGRLLLRLGCVFGQGYGIAWPMLPEMLPAWAASWKPEPAWRTISTLGPGRRHLLQAAVAHRAWSSATESFLLGQRHAPPSFDSSQCRLGRWIERERSSAAADLPSFTAVDETHLAVHALCAQLAASESPDRRAPDPSIAELRRLRDLLGERIDQLLQQTALPF